MTCIKASDIIKIARHVADTGGFCLCLGVDMNGDTWRLSVLPGKAFPYVVQVQHTWREKGRTRHAWHEWEGFVLLIDAAAAFCALVGQEVAEMSQV